MQMKDYIYTLQSKRNQQHSECVLVKKHWLLHGNSSSVFPESSSEQAVASAQKKMNCLFHTRYACLIKKYHHTPTSISLTKLW